MAFNLFKKNIVVGVSVSPELGLEVAQIDFATKTVLKYGAKQLGYDNLRKEIADLDLFKETLSDLLTEMEIPKGSEIVLNLPTILFKVEDFSAAMEANLVEMQIEETLSSYPIFQNNEAVISAVRLPISTIQNNKVAYTAAQKVPLIEIAMQIKSLGYTVVGIDTSVNSVLNALIYNERVDVAADANWVLLIVDNNSCRIIPMLGKSYADSFEEKIAIGEVLGDAENYSTVVSAVSPILKNVPSKRLYVLSRTNAINAEVTFHGQIIHHNDNIFSEAPYLETAPQITEQAAKMISLDVIGAAINRDFGEYSVAPINMFNASLGEVYENEQPLKLNIGPGFLLTLENMIVASVAFALIVLLIIAAVVIPLKAKISSNNNEISNIESQIAEIQKFLDENKNVSADMFDEGDEVRLGLQHNKNVYTYYTIVGTEIPKKLWLKLQKLGLASKSKLVELADEESFDTDSIITSMNADFYEFRISDAPEVAVNKKPDNAENSNGELPSVDLGE